MLSRWLMSSVRPVAQDYYVDSVGGNNSNNGTTTGDPLQTLAAAAAKLTTDNKNLWPLRQSHRRRRQNLVRRCVLGAISKCQQLLRIT